MNISIDIGHPAHVHLFKYFIREMVNRGHKTLITATDKDVTLELLHNLDLPYVPMGSYGRSLPEKIINVPLMDLKMYKAVRRFKPDLFLGVRSVRAAHVSKLMGKPCLAFGDTEPAGIVDILSVPFTDYILTPSCFKKDYGKKHIRYEGFHELAYLHPDHFKPDSSVLEKAGLGIDEKFTVLRTVSWNAVHDIGQKGFARVEEAVSRLEKYGRVLVSAEGDISTKLNRNIVKIKPEEIHHLLYYAALYIGEGATMATEAAFLGTPSIFVSSLAKELGNLDELEHKYGLLFSFSEQNEAVDKACLLLEMENTKKQMEVNKSRLMADKIDVTKFMIDMIEGYPNSLKRD